ncbi:unnamed protein product [Arctogadus glacialis]
MGRNGRDDGNKRIRNTEGTHRSQVRMPAMQGTLSLRGLQVLRALVLPVLWALVLPVVCALCLFGFLSFRRVDMVDGSLRAFTESKEVVVMVAVVVVVVVVVAVVVGEGTKAHP